MSNSLDPFISLALLSSSTTQFLADSLKNAFRREAWKVHIWQSGFNLYRQDILNHSSSLYDQRPDVTMLYLDGEDLLADWLRNPLEHLRRDWTARANAALTDLETLVTAVRERLPNSLIILNTIYLPPVNGLTGLEYHSEWSVSECIADYNSGLGRLARRHTDLLILDVSSLVANLGYQQWFDARLWYLARCRMSSKATQSLTRSIIALLRAWRGETRKCLVLDLDNTLWGGIVGEDGIDGIQLGESGLGLAFAEFQQELCTLARKGVLLAICSKNDELEALNVLQKHPFMRLRLTDFAALRVNWENKASNLKELAAELNLGLESFVFIDDNPAERDLVRTSLPEVLVPEWPQDPSEFKAALLELAADTFSRTSLTAEDQQRSAMYQVGAERRALAAASGNLEDYLRSLKMRVSVDAADSSSIKRIAQLTQKTNQFNLTTRRYTDTDIRGLLDAGAVVWALQLADRFADEGIVGVLILRELDPHTWNIDTLLLSCRVIGRMVENALVAHAYRYLRNRGVKALNGEYLPTKRNGLAANLYRDLGFDKIDENQECTRWRMELDKKELVTPDWIELKTMTEISHA